MAYSDAIALINQFIVENHNNEITAEILNPVLQGIVDACRETTGLPADLATADKSNLVAAINELFNAISEFTISGVQVYSGLDNPNITPPPAFSVADFYKQVDSDNNVVALFQWDGSVWTTGSASEENPKTAGVPILIGKGYSSGSANTQPFGQVGDYFYWAFSETDLYPFLMWKTGDGTDLSHYDILQGFGLGTV